MHRPLAPWILMLVLYAMTGLAQAGELSAKALETARTQGSVRVLVMLRDAPDGAKNTRDGGHERKRDVEKKVSGVLARLPGQSHKLHRRFALIPAMALEADAATLEHLRDDPDVVRIDVDMPGSGNAVAPDEASVLNNISPLQGLGFSGAGMKVAVIDSGVDTDHPDLQSRLIGQQCFCSNAAGTGGCCPNGQASQSGAGSAEDDHGHGTNVSGIIVGQGNAAPRGGIPDAQLVAVKVLDRAADFCCSSDIVAAMDWVAANHPDVDAVNLSLGTSARFGGDCDNATAYTQAMAVAVESLIARGAVVTVSTGNEGDSGMTRAPACVRNAVGVGATWDFAGGSRTFLGCTEISTAPRQPACFTNRSTTTDLYAAGAFVTAAGLNGGTSIFGGTSQAAPMVAACAVALKQSAPAATVQQRIEAMRLSQTLVTDPVSTRRYPFLDCIDALRLLAPRARAGDDFDGDGRSDILWRNTSTGANAVWKSANSATPQPMVGVSNPSWKVVGIGDFDGDRKSDVFWRNASSGVNAIWRSGNSATQQAVAGVSNLSWKVVGIGDFDGDGKSDVFWRNAATGVNAIWKSGNSATQQPVAGVSSASWTVVGIGDFDGDGKSDVLWRNSATGANSIWKSGNAATPQAIASVPNQAWRVVGIGDFDGDGRSDVFWRNSSSGGNTIWNSGNAATPQVVTTAADQAWKLEAAGDYDGDGKSDALWRNDRTGANALWRSGNSASPQAVTHVGSTAWTIVP